MAAVDIDHDGVITQRSAAHVAARVVRDKAAANRLAQEALLGNGADLGVDVDVGVLIARLPVGQGESPGAQHQNLASFEFQFIEQDAAQVLDIAEVLRRLAVINLGRERIVDKKGAQAALAGLGHRLDRVVGIGRVHNLIGRAQVDGDADEPDPECRGPALAAAVGQQQAPGGQQQGADQHRGRHPEPLHHHQRKTHRAQKRAQRGPVKRVATGFARARVLHEVGQHRHGLPKQPGQRTQHAADEEQVGQPGRLDQAEHAIDGDARQAHARNQRREQKIARHDGREIRTDARARAIAQRKCEQEQPDGRRRHDDGAADVGHQPAQRNDLGAE